MQISIVGLMVLVEGWAITASDVGLIAESLGLKVDVSNRIGMDKPYLIRVRVTTGADALAFAEILHGELD